jgi:hypothetical protein
MMSGNHETPNTPQAGLVADGWPRAGDRTRHCAETWQRAREANAPRIEREVRARYATQLATADICDQLQIEVRIRAEIEQALAAAVPREACY